MTTFADTIIRETLRPKTRMINDTGRSMADIRNAILHAKKFVLDESMSGFLAELSMVPFLAANVRRADVLDSMRHGALLPYPKVWIELDGKAFRRAMINKFKSRDAWGEISNPDEATPVWGWLLEEHPQLPTAIRMREFFHVPEEELIGLLPFEVAWSTQDDALPWKADPIAGMLAHGITPYECPQIGVMTNKPLTPKTTTVIRLERDGKLVKHPVHTLVGEMGGLVRHAMAFLSTLNDVPTVRTEVKPQKGFFARGQHRQFVEHTVLRLRLPQNISTTRLAMRITIASRRRRHWVRPHWRMFTKKAGVLCDMPSSHLWSAVNDAGHAHCTKCSAWRTWIEKHTRGDAGLGFVTHDYLVEHQKEHRR